jgi:signal transduction histidine kinase
MGVSLQAREAMAREFECKVSAMSLHLPSWRRLLSLRLVGPLALVLSVAVIVTNELGLGAALEVNAGRDASVQTRTAIDRARLAVLLMESAQRGYLLTGRPEYRVPYDVQRAQTTAMLESLRNLAARSPAHRQVVTQLVEMVERRLSELAEVMRLFDAGERDRAVMLTMTDIGREQMERINALVDSVVRDEEAAYQRGALQRDRVSLWSRVALYSLLLLCLAVVVVARRMARERERDRASHVAELNAERDGLEDKVARRTRDLSDLARHLQTVREDERSRLARELHDELGGLLTAAKLDVARMRKRLLGAAPEVGERIDHLAQALDAGIALKRRIIEDLRPSSLANLGLQKTLEIQCAEFAARAEIRVEASIAALDLTQDRELAIYRIVQEALNNVAKYAKARTVQVSLVQVGDQAQIQVRDDGVGFDPGQMRIGAHGLAGMRFRVKSFGGDWVLHSAPGQGTLVQARIPLGEASGDEPSPMA